MKTKTLHSKEEHSPTRRDFLRKTASSTALLTLGSASALKPRVYSLEASRQKLGFALVGLGNLSTNQIAPALQKTHHCELKAIVTGTPEKEQAWAQKYGIPASNIFHYGNYDKIKDNDDVDVVYIVLPNGLHAEYTIRAAHAGKHVLCEKPMANTAKDCADMIAACRSNDRKLAVGYRCQFEPHHQECIRIARSGVFGSPRYIDAGFGFKIGDPQQWRLRQKLAGGGALMDVGIYALQACRYIFGEEPISVFATETKTDPVKFREVDETMTWSMRFPSGGLANCSTSYAFSGVNYFKAYGAKGWFTLNPGYSYSGIKGERSDKKNLRFDDIDQFAAEMDDFAQCILEDKESRVSGEEGLRDLKVIEGIYRSVKEKKQIALF